MGMLDGKIAIVTGAGGGLGRAEALELASRGAAVVVNDLGGPVDGRGQPDHRAAEAVVALIRERGGRAVANYADIANWEAARGLVEQAIAELGGLDILVNNAGILRVGPFLDLGEDDLDALLRVHVKGTAATLQHAGRYWRGEHLAGRGRHAAVVNTTSNAGLPGSREALAWYGAAKAAVASLTVSAAFELFDYGVRVNAIAPHGATRMLAYTFGRTYKEQTFTVGFDPFNPDNNAPIVAWLASDEAARVTGQVFDVLGGTIAHFEPWRWGGKIVREGRWEADEIGAAMESNVFSSSDPSSFAALYSAHSILRATDGGPDFDRRAGQSEDC